jgi:hypothetical protein
MQAISYTSAAARASQMDLFKTRMHGLRDLRRVRLR